MSDPMMRPKAAMLYLGVGKTTLYELVKSGALPAPVRISKRASGWRQSQLAAYVSSLRKAA